jgi:predicted RNA-binding protein
VPGYGVSAQGWQRRRDLTADLATIIPVGKKVRLISLFGEEKEIKTSSEEIYL